MSIDDVDALFGAGLDLGHDVVVKAQVRFRVRPPEHPAAQDVVDRVVAAYDERLDMIMESIAGILRQPDRDGAPDPALVVPNHHRFQKAVPRAPFRPGSRGGKWYRDAKGNVRYGDPPEGRFMGNAGTNTPAPQLDHLMTRPFMGAFGNDRELTGFLVDRGGRHGFSAGELRFLSAWYGTDDAEGGELFDAFLECTGLTREDLKGGVANLRFGSKQLTYEEAVFEFFAAQGSLFLGEEPTTEEQVAEWHRILNDDIKPLLDGVFLKYEEAKDDESVQQGFIDEPARRRRRFFAKARRSTDVVDGVASSVVGAWDPVKQVDAVVAGMELMGLFTRRARSGRAAYIHGRPHLRDAVSVDGRLFDVRGSNPLLGDDGLSRLSASQLMLMYAAAELHRRWDPHTRAFSSERQAEVGDGDLGQALLAALEGKDSRWSEASSTVRSRLADLVDRLVVRLNSVNSDEGTPELGDVARKQGQ